MAEALVNGATVPQQGGDAHGILLALAAVGSSFDEMLEAVQHLPEAGPTLLGEARSSLLPAAKAWVLRKPIRDEDGSWLSDRLNHIRRLDPGLALATLGALSLADLERTFGDVAPWLGYLDLSGWSDLERLPELQGAWALNLHGCVSLQTIPEGLKVGRLWLGDCVSLRVLPAGLKVTDTLDMAGCVQWDGVVPAGVAEKALQATSGQRPYWVSRNGQIGIEVAPAERMDPILVNGRDVAHRYRVNRGDALAALAKVEPQWSALDALKWLRRIKAHPAAVGHLVAGRLALTNPPPVELDQYGTPIRKESPFLTEGDVTAQGALFFIGALGLNRTELAFALEAMAERGAPLTDPHANLVASMAQIRGQWLAFGMPEAPHKFEDQYILRMNLGRDLVRTLRWLAPKGTWATAATAQALIELVADLKVNTREVAYAFKARAEGMGAKRVGNPLWNAGFGILSHVPQGMGNPYTNLLTHKFKSTLLVEAVRIASGLPWGQAKPILDNVLAAGTGAATLALRAAHAFPEGQTDVEAKAVRGKGGERIRALRALAGSSAPLSPGCETALLQVALAPSRATRIRLHAIGTLALQGGEAARVAVAHQLTADPFSLALRANPLGQATVSHGADWALGRLIVALPDPVDQMALAQACRQLFAGTNAKRNSMAGLVWPWVKGLLKTDRPGAERILAPLGLRVADEGGKLRIRPTPTA
jgi:hypothetical protein